MIKTHTVMEELSKLKKAWNTAPPGAKTMLFKTYPEHTRQNVRDILSNGRKDSEKMTILLNHLKLASSELTKGIVRDNDKIQSI